MQISSPTDSLRERKKAQVRADLERAARELALERDLDEVTIDEICARVPVSHRTFFNYFDSKEDALFDVRRAWGDPGWIARRLDETYDGSVIAALVQTLFTDPSSGDAEPGAREARMLIASRHPGLLRRRARHLDDLRAGLVSTVADFVADRCAGAAETADGLGVAPSAQAEVLVAACVAAVRIAVREWADAGATGSEDEVTARAVAIARSLAPFVG